MKCGVTRNSWNSMELWDLKIKTPPSSVEFNGTFRLLIWYTSCAHGVPMNIPWNSMEFHGTFWSPNLISPSSVELDGILREPFQMLQRFHWIPWNIPWNMSWNSVELWSREFNCDQVPSNSIEDRHFCLITSVFYRIIGIIPLFPWKSSVTKNKYQQSQIPWNLFIFWRAPFQITERFHGIFQGIPWNFENFNWHQVPLDFHGIFHGTGGASF